MTTDLAIRTRDHLQLVAQNALTSMTAYVMLEQEQWFEQEVEFVRALARPGMHALDIGANHGAYTLVFAAGLCGSGHVWSFEPTSTPFARLSESVRINALAGCVTAMPVGLSDRTRQARINVSANSELNSLQGETGTSENVTLRALDEIIPECTGGARIDFIKLDAEGEELRILRGGALFFARQSPLVMFEIRHGNEFNTGLWDAFIRMGYGLYRHVPGLNLLAPVAAGETFEAYQLNLFAAKPERASELAARGLLAGSAASATVTFAEHSQALGPTGWKLPSSSDSNGTSAVIDLPDWLPVFEALPYARGFMGTWMHHVVHPRAGVPARHVAALAAYLSARSALTAPAVRLHRLEQAIAVWRELWSSGSGPLSIGLCLARACADLGMRSEALTVLMRTWQGMQSAAQDAFALPFLPPVADFDQRAPRGTLMQWLIAAMLEAYETWRAFSSYFTTDSADILRAHLDNPDLSPALRRRYVLHTRRAGAALLPGADEPLLVASDDNLNSTYWSASRAPTWVAPPALAQALGAARATP